jgi:tetratricopeptide (TPR) repeat protein
MYRFEFQRILILFGFFSFNIFVFSQQNQEFDLQRAIAKEKNTDKRFSLIYELGELYQLQNIQKADSISKILLKVADIKVPDNYCKALLFSAEISEKQGNQAEYFEQINKCLPYIDLIRDKILQLKIRLLAGNYFAYLLNFNQSNFHLNKAVSIAINSKQNRWIAESYIYKAWNYMIQNNKDSAVYFTDRALVYARRSDSKYIQALCLNSQAKVFDYFGQIELSVAKNINALQIAYEANNRYQIAKFNREIGISQRSIFNLDDAEYYFNQSIEYAKLIRDDRQLAMSLSNLGMVYFDRKKYDQAIQTMRNAIAILNQQQDLNGLGESYNNLGIIYREKKSYNEAASNFNQALVYFEATGNKEKIAGVYHNVGTIFQKQRKYKNALNYLERSIEIREKFGSKNEIYKTYRVLSEIYKSLGNSTKALYYLQLYLDYIDGNTTIQSARKIAELSEAYRSDQRERLISSQADSIEKQRQEKTLTATKLENTQLRNNLMLYIIIGLIIIAVLGVVIGFYRWNQTKIKQQRREAEMSQTLLRTQMNPHFIFNAMSVIQSYIFENDSVNSSKFLVNFSRLMRLILENSPKEFIPLETEIEILQKYLETQKLRFEDRFEFSINIDDDIAIDQTMIPPMITQPFIENALEHGQLHTIDGGIITISFKREKEMLEILIEDNGIGRKGAELNKKSKAHKSMAMQITKERIDNINQKYKTKGMLSIEDLNKDLETGTKVFILLPHKEEKPNA